MTELMKCVLACSAFLFAVMAMAQPAAAAIECDGPYQIIRGQGNISTPYCENKYIADVAHEFGVNVSFAEIHQNPNIKKDVCRFVGHDERLSSICTQYLNTIGTP